MTTAIFRLVHAEARRRAIEYIRNAPDGHVVRVSEPRKSREQEEKYHAMVGEIAAQFKFCDRLWDAEDMKRLLLDQFRRDTVKDPDFAELWKSMGIVEMAPSLDGAGVVALGVQSRKFPKKLASAFVEWLYAWGAATSVKFED